MDLNEIKIEFITPAEVITGCEPGDSKKKRPRRPGRKRAAEGVSRASTPDLTGGKPKNPISCSSTSLFPISHLCPIRKVIMLKVKFEDLQKIFPY